MIAANHSTNSQDLKEYGNFLKVGEAAEFLGVSHSQIRLLCSKGELECHTTFGSHRRISAESISQYAFGVGLNESADNDAGGKGIYLYCRTSSESQRDALKNQKARLTEEVCKREGCKPEDLEIISECCSSMSANRKGLNKLVELMIKGSVKRIYLTYWDRISRSPAQTGLIEHIARMNRVEIVCVDEQEDLDAHSEMVKEVLNLITVFANRASSAKAAKLRAKTYSPETVERIAQLHKGKHSIKRIGEILAKENILTEQGTPIRQHNLKKFISQNKEMLETIATKSDDDKAIAWMKTNIEKTDNLEEKISSIEVWERYSSEMARKGKKTDSRKMVGIKATKFFDAKRVKRQKDRREFLGYKFK